MYGIALSRIGMMIAFDENPHETTNKRGMG